MAESTPLLNDIDENTRHIDTRTDEFEAQTNLLAETTPASAHFKPFIRILIIITLVLSTLTVALLIANYIIVRHAPFGWYTWDAQEASKTLAIFLFVSLVFSVINILANFPILLNIIVDVVLAAGVIQWVVRLLIAFPDSNWCRIQYPYPRPGYPTPEPIPPHPKCEDWKLVVKILTGIAGGFGGIIGVIYVGLLVLRSIAIFRTKFWKRPLAWTFPTGKISLEISLKVLKQESATTGNVGQSGSGVHGPVYL
jgi:hypothetical protein